MIIILKYVNGSMEIPFTVCRFLTKVSLHLYKYIYSYINCLYNTIQHYNVNTMLQLSSATLIDKLQLSIPSCIETLLLLLFFNSLQSL